MSQILKSIFVGCAAVLLAGCATRYGPYYRWLHTGYTDSRVAPNSFQVAFHGDRQYSQSHAEDFCYLRCAELALKHGYAGYQIRDFTVRTSTCTRIEEQFGPAGLKPAYVTSTNYSVSIAFDCIDRAAGAEFIDAREQVQLLRKKYNLPPGNDGLSELEPADRPQMQGSGP